MSYFEVKYQWDVCFRNWIYSFVGSIDGFMVYYVGLKFQSITCRKKHFGDDALWRRKNSKIKWAFFVKIFARRSENSPTHKIFVTLSTDNLWISRFYDHMWRIIPTISVRPQNLKATPFDFDRRRLCAAWNCTYPINLTRRSYLSMQIRRY